MKANKTATLVLITTIIFASAFASSNAYAAPGKQKPPVAETTQAKAWYQPVFDFFSFY